MSRRKTLSTSETQKTSLLPQVTKLTVWHNSTLVGTMALTSQKLAAFEYDATWLQQGFSISPLSLPLQNRVFIPKEEPFDGLFGVFQDSLPDGWGALLLDRKLREMGIDPSYVGPMTRLAIVGSSGRGALKYKPEIVLEGTDSYSPDLDVLASLCNNILNNLTSQDLDIAYTFGGSSGGARPKAYVKNNEGIWLIKFPSSYDMPDIGLIEYRYAECAKSCGIDLPQTKLFPSKLCSGYFGTQRFDRDKNGAGIHMVSASGMLEVSHRQPVLDYRHLFQLCNKLSFDTEQLLKLYRLMCFNVFAHNQDDHSNNFSWLYKDGTWQLSPAYDLTYSTSFGNEHTTTVNGKGNPTLDDILLFAEEIGLPKRISAKIAHETQAACHNLLHELNLP
ncbi:MAG: type II toxin-antitoxin system HipA family toxin [Coriobacteriales bacterium]|nr:type II toxin-antitoxin system HipA family toxin [Coriobacteriales bacterium]